MSLTAKRLVIGPAVLIASIVALAPAAAASDTTAVITGGAIVGSLNAKTDLVVTVGSWNITCSTHSVQATTAAKTYVSLSSNSISGCTVRETGNSVSASVTNTTPCQWTYTAWDLSGQMYMTAPESADPTCLTFFVTVLGFNVCQITITKATVKLFWNETTKRATTNGLNSVPYTSSGMPCPASGNATMQETLFLTTTTTANPKNNVSVTSV